MIKSFVKSHLSKKTFPEPRNALGTLLLVVIGFAIPAPAAREQSAWKVETVDDGHGGDVGKYDTLVIDKDGNIHIAYYDASRNALRYAYRGSAEKRWDVMQVDKQSGQYASLAVDSHGHPHFAYNSIDLKGLHYAYWDGTHWLTQIIDNQRTHHFTSVQVDRDGYPHISYYQEENPDGTYALHLKYAFFDGKMWYVETISRKYATGKFNSIALDSGGRPHIAYSFAALGDLGYVFWDGSHWVYQVPDTRRTHNNYVGQGNSIAIDSRDRPHIAYFDLNNRAIKYTERTGSDWQTEVVDKVVGSLSQADHLSLKLDKHDRPHLAYVDTGVGAVKYAERDDTGWHTEVVEQGALGEYPSLCLNDKDEPYISYHDATDGDLRIAYPERNSKTPIPTAHR